MKNKNAGYYIWIGDTCVAGPFQNESEAWVSLEHTNRLKWTWELNGGLEAFLAIPTDAFDVIYSRERP